MLVVSLLELQSAIVTLLNIRKNGLASVLSNESENLDMDDKTPLNCVHLMKFNVIDDMFQLRIGTERSSIQSRLFSNNSIYKSHEAFSGITFLEDEDDVIDNYERRQMYTKFAKEHLAITLLMVAALHTSMKATPSRKK